MSSSVFSFSNPGSSIHAIATIKPDTILENRYKLISKLGSGGFGEVWKASDLYLRQAVAIKISSFDPSDNSDRTIREVRFLRRLPRDRFINVFDYFRDETIGFHGYSMEELQIDKWESLDSYIVSGQINEIQGAWTTVRVILEVYKDLIKSIGVLHSKEWVETDKNYSLIHGDIKPHNMYANVIGINALVTGFGRKYSLAKIGDFGLSRANGLSILGGTKGFAPAADNAIGKLTPKFDIYSLGQSMLYGISGVCANPKQGIAKIIEGKIKRFAKNKTLSSDLIWIISGMIKKQPENRDELSMIAEKFDLSGLLSELDWQIIRCLEVINNTPTSKDEIESWLMQNYFTPVQGKRRLVDGLKKDINKSIINLKAMKMIRNTKKLVYELSYA